MYGAGATTVSGLSNVCLAFITGVYIRNGIHCITYDMDRLIGDGDGDGNSLVLVK